MNLLKTLRPILPSQPTRFDRHVRCAVSDLRDLRAIEYELRTVAADLYPKITTAYENSL